MRQRVMQPRILIVALIAVLSIAAVAGGATLAAQEPDQPGRPGRHRLHLPGPADRRPERPPNGQYDFQFRLYDGSGESAGQIGETVTVSDKAVDDGRFTLKLDFGANAFTGDARWLEVSVRDGDSDGGYTQLLPRQALAPAPYAVHAGQAPWSGLTGMPAGIADGDDDTTYSAGAGLSLSGGVFSADFDGSGSANTVARSDHDHLGQTWTSQNDPLVLSGTFDTEPTTAPLVLENAGHYGVVVRSGGSGVLVDKVGGDGVLVERADAYGIYVLEGDADHDGWGGAGYFGGEVEVTDDLYVTGNIYNSGGSTRIDHPQDPENKTLSHSFVESPEMMNVYNGNVTTGDEGFATVTLPDYFEALNTDYRYQLTVIGAFAQAIIAEEIEDNHFVIQTDEPNVKVSWQVTGVRNDPYAQANPIVVEEEKPADQRGLYLHPEAYGLPSEMGIDQRRGEREESQ